MFTIDTGNTVGSDGPFVSWTSEGSARKGLAPESWVLRSKPEGATEWQSAAIPAFANGCVMDLDRLKLGWEKDSAQGVAPERRWNPSVSQATPRPDDAKKPGGGYVWSKALSVRIAIGGGEAATWEQAAFGAYEAFDRLAKLIMAEWQAKSQNGALLPLVVQTGIDRMQMKHGATSIPILTIQDWVARPDCLKADAPAIATAPAAPAQPAAPVAQPAAAQPAQTAQPAQPAQPATSVPAGAGF